MRVKDVERRATIHWRRTCVPPHSHAAFFDNANKDAAARRESIAMDTLDSLFDYLESGEGEVGIFDATNSTRQRRKAILDRVKRRFEGTGKACGVVFIETICTDPYVLHSNMLVKVRNSPDFAGLDEATALADLRRRNAHYESAYEPLSDSEGASYITIYSFSSKVTCSLCFGRITRVVLPFLLAIHVDERPIYLVAWRRAASPLPVELRARPSTVRPSLQPRTPRRIWRLRLRAWCASAKEPPLHVLLGVDPSARGRRGVGRGGFVHCCPRPVREGGPAGRAPRPRRPPRTCDYRHRGSVAPTLVITHATPARALLAYMHNRPRVRVVDETATTEAPRTLAGADAAVIEVRAIVAGGYSETVHLLPARTARRRRRPQFSRARRPCPGTSGGAGRSARSAGRRVSSSPECLFCCPWQCRAYTTGLLRPRLRHRSGFGIAIETRSWGVLPEEGERLPASHLQMAYCRRK